MGKIKGTAVDEIRTLIKKSGSEIEAKFKALLTPEEKEMFSRSLPISWVDLELLTPLAYKVADLLFPNDADKLIKVGIHSSQYSLSTVYRILMRVMSVEQVLKQASKLWRTYHSQGRVELERVSGEERKVHFIIYDYPDLLRSYIPVLAAYVHGTMTMTGARDIMVNVDDKDPNAWKLVITWK